MCDQRQRGFEQMIDRTGWHCRHGWRQPVIKPVYPARSKGAGGEELEYARGDPFGIFAVARYGAGAQRLAMRPQPVMRAEDGTIAAAGINQQIIAWAPAVNIGKAQQPV